MKLTRLFSILFMIGLTISGANVFAQQDPSAPTRLALEVTFYPGRKPAYETVPGPDSKPSGAWFGMFALIKSWQAPAGAPPVVQHRVPDTPRPGRPEPSCGPRVRNESRDRR